MGSAGDPLPPNYEAQNNTSPIVNQPKANQFSVPVQGQGQWKYGLGDCFSNFGLCIVATWLPCITYGQVQDKIGSGDFCGQVTVHVCLANFFPCGLCCILSSQRMRVRQQHGIPEGSGCASDCCIATWCPCCALIQHGNQV